MSRVGGVGELQSVVWVERMVRLRELEGCAILTGGVVMLGVRNRLWKRSAVGWLVVVAAVASVPAVAWAAAWSPAGSMNGARSFDSAVLLGNGQVLVAGGFDGASVIGSAELYDPSTDTWTTTGAMSAVRATAVMVRLGNGNVLIAGGAQSFGPPDTSTAEVYHPSTGVWTLTGSMHNARDDFGAVRMPNGNVLVAGGGLGTATTTLTATAEVYHPSSGTWTTTGSMHVPRTEFVMTGVETPGGFRVLVAGGVIDAAGTRTNTAELYNPTTRSWSYTGSLHVARSDAQSAHLSGDDALVAGGTSDGSGALPSVEVYDGSEGQWTRVARLPTALFEGAAVKLGNGEVLVAGGLTAPDTPSAAAEVYDPQTNTWSTGPAMTFGREGLDLTSLANGKALADGGIIPAGHVVTTSAEVFSP